MNTSLPSSDCPSSSHETVQVVVACFFLLVFPISLLLNGVAMWVSLHLQSVSTFIVYLKNLVVADLVMTLMLPVKALAMLPEATTELRAFDCRYTGVIYFTSLYTSIALMGLISLDRFFKIVRPFGKLLGQNVTFSIIMSSMVWVVLFGCTAIPIIILTDHAPANITDDAKDFCTSLKGPAGVNLSTCVVLFMEILFWVVSILIVFCYICITVKVLQSFRNSGSNNSQGQKKTKLRVFSVLFVFFVCFVPWHILRIPVSLSETSDTCPSKWLLIAHELALCVSSTNACLDPFLYIQLCKEYKAKLADMMKGSSACVKLYCGERKVS
ncbi:P2Y purinoceptor 13-like [Cololabis saira]|uniref:P2Y purinoceptor 13-like n=1 Tax=Cololabis saira TaxID=129043 RepID=UPI002AD35CB2|nr:P2Y purinoceptor 13-like [Cololabis saira]